MEDSGKMGAVAKKQKAVREEEKRLLKGQAGKSLYLEALQLLLRSQLAWLVSEKEYPLQLETTVRDLWDLRIRGFPAEAAQEASSASGDKLEMFSSQMADANESKRPASSKSRAQSWDSDRGLAWPMPGLRDTLVLCYLGCCLLRIPTRIGEILYWANERHIPYKSAVSVYYSEIGLLFC